LVTVTGIDALCASVTVSVQLPTSAPGCSVKTVAAGAVAEGAGVAVPVTTATYGLDDGAGLGTGFAVHASDEVNAAVLPVSVTLTVAGAGLLTSKPSPDGLATGVGLGDGDGLALAVGLGDGLALAGTL
jgi:hypothetical protein